MCHRPARDADTHGPKLALMQTNTNASRSTINMWRLMRNLYNDLKRKRRERGVVTAKGALTHGRGRRVRFGDSSRSEVQSRGNGGLVCYLGCVDRVRRRMEDGTTVWSLQRTMDVSGEETSAKSRSAAHCGLVWSFRYLCKGWLSPLWLFLKGYSSLGV